MLYRVIKENYMEVLIEDLGIMNIEEIEEFGKKYINSVHQDLIDLKKDIQYIIDNGDELWLLEHDEEIRIEKII